MTSVCQASRQREVLSIVVPCFNEQEVLATTHARLQAVLRDFPFKTEIIFVDDGSSDATREVITRRAAVDANVKAVFLSRNFGHQIAVTAGLRFATGDAVIVIDADLQDPPEVMVPMVAKWKEGFDVVYGRRIERVGESWFKRITARWFYRFVNRISDIPIPLDVGDFRLLSRRAVDAFNQMPESDRFIRGMVAWVGFQQAAIQYRRDPRLAGVSKYPLRKMIRFAWDGIASFSDAPARIATMIGFVTLGIATIVAMQVVVGYCLDQPRVPGWTSTFLAIMFLGGVQMLCIGILGQYAGRIYREVKRRPLYFVAGTLNIRPPQDTDHPRCEWEQL